MDPGRVKARSGFRFSCSCMSCYSRSNSRNSGGHSSNSSSRSSRSWSSSSSSNRRDVLEYAFARLMSDE